MLKKRSELAAAEPLQGRFVQGVDPTTRWLRLDSGGYVWDGNLSGQNASQDLSACAGEQPPTSVADAERWLADCKARSLQMASSAVGKVGAGGGSWPTDDQVRSVIERSLGRNEMVSGCMATKPVVNGISVLKRGVETGGVFPLAVEISYVCPAAPIYGLGEERHTKSLKYYFKVDSFGDWQSVPEPK